jgi:hypothetical protein
MRNERPAVSSHAPNRCEQLSHSCDDGDLARFARGPKAFVILVQPRIASHGVENHHPNREDQNRPQQENVNETFGISTGADTASARSVGALDGAGRGIDKGLQVYQYVWQVPFGPDHDAELESRHIAGASDLSSEQ